MNRKIFILDTSVLLYDKTSIHSFNGNDIVLPLVILEELDKFKDRPGLLGESARYVNRFLDSLRSIETIKGWRYLEEFDMRYKFELAGDAHTFVPEGLDLSYNDNFIIACAMMYMKSMIGGDQILRVVTKDINMRVKCDACGVPAEDYHKDRLKNNTEIFKGWKDITLKDSIINSFYLDGVINYPEDIIINPNEFVIAKSETSNKSLIGINKNNTIEMLNKKIEGLIHVDPRNSEQRFAIEALMDPDIPLVTLTGLAGSGKTFLALMAGLANLRNNKGSSFNETLDGYDRLVITRTLQPVGKDLGYLPGTMEDKMAPWLMPILDNVRHAFKDISYFQMMVEKGEIEVAPIPYIRGRTFNSSFVIVDEAQNATIHELKTIITRIGTNSKIILLGDVDQIDTPYIDRQSSGLSIVIDRFINSPLAAHVNLSKGQRSDLASEASIIL